MGGSRRIGIVVMALVLGQLLASGCSDSPTGVAGGSSTEIPNGVVATVRCADGTPAGGVTVRLRPATYVATTVLSKGTRSTHETTTDDSGRFAIDSLGMGEYRIEATDEESSAVVIDLAVLDTTLVSKPGDLTLKPYATVSGHVREPGVAFRHQMLRVQVYGLERLLAVGPDGSFRADDLPEGTHAFRLHSVAEDIPSRDLGAAQATAADTAILEPRSAWNGTGRLYLNTATGGADIAQDIARFPLFVALDTGNFDFSRAAADGSDLLFYDMQGSPLPHVVDSWDSVAGVARLWVSVDTIRGNDSTQFIEWFADRADTSTPPGGVFDAAPAVRGMWSFDGFSPFTDRTGRAGEAVNHGSMPAAGVAGSGRELAEGDSSYVELPIAGMDFRTTGGGLELWMRTDSNYPAPGMIFYASEKGGDGFGLYTEFHLSVDELRNELRFDAITDSATVRTIHFGGSALDGAWHHVAVTWNTTDSVRVFYDGIQAGRDRHVMHDVVFTEFAALGKPLLDRRYFHGGLDEFVYYNAVPSPAWLKLRYENLRPGSKLVSGRPPE